MASVRRRVWRDENAAASRRSNGRTLGECWEVSYTDPDGKRRKKSGFRLKEDAERFGVEQEAKIANGLYRPEGERMSMAAAAERWLQDLQTKVERDIISKGHRMNIEGHLRNYICRVNGEGGSVISKQPAQFAGGLGDKIIGRILPPRCEAFMMDMLRTTLHWRTVKAVMVTLHSFFEYQKTKGWIATNPAEGISVETPRTERGKRRYPPSIAALRDMHDRTSEPFRLIYEVAASTGLREGELRALRIDCVQLGKAQVKVERAFDDENKEVPPKSSAGYRSIPLGANLCDRLQVYLDDKLGGSTDLLFTRPDGTPFRPGNFLGRMDRLIAGENWPKQMGEAREGQLARFTWHALRHYAISSWIAAGLGIKAVQTFAGHADISTTWDRYGYLFPDDQHWVLMNRAGVTLYGAPQPLDLLSSGQTKFDLGALPPPRRR